MEIFFTQATMVVELFGVGYVASSFATYAHQRLNQPSKWKSCNAFTSEEDTLEEDAPEARTGSKRKPTPVELLRQQCQEAGIKWRHAHGKNKHLKKAEMIEALRKIEQAKRVTAPQPKSTNNPASSGDRAA
ncbi:MAG: hypothetical protein HC769_22015 [Cyanobacteria bacterium CRU_2_1]|nr:hypothetical protein [Cyanobacteria bacterium RU_5_0]NJR61268.1 hypothetical protein [Cyanobacteria bacterium CRU_2_1]